MELDIEVSNGSLQRPARQVEPLTRKARHPGAMHVDPARDSESKPEPKSQPEPELEPEIELGPGWYESSRTLRLGLWVLEGNGIDTDTDIDTHTYTDIVGERTSSCTADGATRDMR